MGRDYWVAGIFAGLCVLICAASTSITMTDRNNVLVHMAPNPRPP